ncbi:MAG: C4-type zinc ribbon domain-containing protein [Pseudomonadota bacterium]
MKEQFDLLEILQALDLSIARLVERIAELPMRIQAIKAEYNMQEAELEECEAELKELERQRKELGSELEASEAKVKKSKENLMHIKTNREYKVSLGEIASIEKVCSGKEDAVLLLMEDIDKAKKRLTEKRISVAKEEGILKEQIAEIETDISNSQQELSDVEARRAELVVRINQDIIAKYNVIQKRIGVFVAAEVKEGGVCGGCHINIPPQMYNELQRLDSIKTCPHCSRLIYYKDGYSGE